MHRGECLVQFPIQSLKNLIEYTVDYLFQKAGLNEKNETFLEIFRFTTHTSLE